MRLAFNGYGRKNRKEKGRRERKKERKKERASPICCALSKTTIFCFRDGRYLRRVFVQHQLFFSVRATTSTPVFIG